MTDIACPDHPEHLAVGTCKSCNREVCETCLEEAMVPEEFECPDCGGYGVAMFDDDYSDLGEPGEEPRYNL